MKLTKQAIAAIRQHFPGIKSKLALALGCSESTINRYIRENSEALTKAALKVIREETGLKDNEILEKDPKSPKADKQSMHISINVSLS